MSGIFSAMQHRVEAGDDAIAIDPVTGPSLSYAQLLPLVGQKMRALEEILDPGTVLATRLDHGLDEALVELAALASGHPLLSLPLFFSEAQTSHALVASGARHIAGPDGVKATPLPPAAPAQIPLGTARISFTSGSTGMPKGICLSEDHMMTVARSVIDAVGVGMAGRHLAILPPGILLETVAGFFTTLLAGGCYVCPPQADVGLANPFRPDFAAMLRAIADLEITSLILVPEYLAGLVAQMEQSGDRLPLLRLVAVGGARISPSQIMRARALGLPVRQGYGLTECASVVSLEEANGYVPGSAGTPLRHMRARLASDGEILLEGPLCLGAIGGEPPETPFHTGDVGRIDDAGRLWVEGRKSNLIITSFGRNISPEWVETSLLAQPEIAQAMVHGDGMAQLEALLVPAWADADLAAAVARANATLPAYAHVGAWREAAHFTPDNGMLTGNGRLRRDAIAATWLGETSFFDRLEASTVRDRLRFLSIPQLQAGLGGTISLQAYRDYLAQAYHHVRHTVPLMRSARERLGHRRDLLAALDEYIVEEEGHEEWILNDIAAAGGDAEAVRASAPHPSTAAMVSHAYDRIATGNPVSFFGMVYVLESVSIALASRGASAVAANLGLPPEAFTYLTSHGALDQEHMVFFRDLVNGFEDEADRLAVIAMAQEMFALFGNVFSSIDLGAPQEESIHVAA